MYDTKKTESLAVRTFLVGEIRKRYLADYDLSPREIENLPANRKEKRIQLMASIAKAGFENSPEGYFVNLLSDRDYENRMMLLHSTEVENAGNDCNTSEITQDLYRELVIDAGDAIIQYNKSPELDMLKRIASIFMTMYRYEYCFPKQLDIKPTYLDTGTDTETN